MGLCGRWYGSTTDTVRTKRRFPEASGGFDFVRAASAGVDRNMGGTCPLPGRDGARPSRHGIQAAKDEAGGGTVLPWNWLVGWMRRWGGRRAETASGRQGRWGEDVAAQFLEGKGWKIAGRNVRYGSRLELDIVGAAEGTVVFVEVKTRANERCGRPFSAVDLEKRRRIARAASRFLRQGGWRLGEKVRFDVVEVVGREGAGGKTVRHIENAFACPHGMRLVDWGLGRRKR